MVRSMVAFFALLVILPASAAWACGAPVVVAPGRPGTAFWEGPNQISVFVANDEGYMWERLKAPDWTRTLVLDVKGTLSGNVETDARVDRAIAGQEGKVVELSSTGTTSVFRSSDGSTIFGASFGPDGEWRVLAYDPTAQTLTLMLETSPGTFSQVDSLPARCGQASMLDSVVEPDGTFLGLCDGRVVEAVGGRMAWLTLPTAPFALGRGSDGGAVFYGRVEDSSGDLVQMRREGSGWTLSSTVSGVSPEWIIPVSETSFLASTPDGFHAYELANGTWTQTAALSADSVTSATGAPVQVLAGQYELTLYTHDRGAWEATDLGAMGVEPQLGPPRAFGCRAGSGDLLLALLALMALIGTERLRRNGPRKTT